MQSVFHFIQKYQNEVHLSRKQLHYTDHKPHYCKGEKFQKIVITAQLHNSAQTVPSIIDPESYLVQ